MVSLQPGEILDSLQIASLGTGIVTNPILLYMYLFLLTECTIFMNKTFNDAEIHIL